MSELIRFYNENGRSPIKSDFGNVNGYPSSFIYRERFGTWNKAIEHVGLKITHIAKYDKQYLKDVLIQFYNKYKRSPTMFDLRAYNLPDECAFISTFGSWNNALRECNLKINHLEENLTGNEVCEICGTTNSKQWGHLNDKRVCSKCAAYDRKYIKGTLNPHSLIGIGVITENIVYKVLNDCIMCNTQDDFHSKYDLISDKYNTINVKSSTLSKNKTCNSSRWRFSIKQVSAVPDYYICIGLSENRERIERVWVINKESSIITNTGINVTNSSVGLSRVKVYEVDYTPYNKIYQDLDITTLFPFRNLNSKEVSV